MSTIRGVLLDEGGAYYNVEAGRVPGQSDAQAIQAALDAHDRVFIPAGTYHLDAPLLVARSGMSLLGAGPRTVLRPAPGVARAIRVNGAPARLADVEVAGLAVDGSAAPFTCIGIEIDAVDRLRVRGVAGAQLQGFVGLDNCADFVLSELFADQMVDTLSFEYCRRGAVTGVTLNRVNEGVDLFDCEELSFSAVSIASWGPGEHRGIYQTGIDFSSSRAVTFTGCTVQGDFQWAMNLKDEMTPAPALSSCVVSGCSFVGFREIGLWIEAGHDPDVEPAGTRHRQLLVQGCTIRSDAAGANGIRTESVPELRMRDLVIADCLVEAPIHAVRIENYAGVQLRGCTLRATSPTTSAMNEGVALLARGGTSPQTGAMITVRTLAVVGCDVASQAAHAVFMDQVVDPLVEGCTLECGGTGVWLRNCRRPTVRGNVLRRPGAGGIRVEWIAGAGIDTARWLDTVNYLIGAVIDGNLVWNWGRAAAGSGAVAVSLAAITGTWSQLSVSANRLLIDAEGTQDGYTRLNGQVGIAFERGSLASLEWAQVDNNLVFGAVEGIRDGGVLGATSTRKDNLVKLQLR
ncbi:MAG TPA: right-handed parallel beta-helix repeat-containing protein [Longimicrobium sp.]|nr:right-handed parallel beta-helix repeat-containing protein [Longimicrobium sp.]